MANRSSSHGARGASSASALRRVGAGAKAGATVYVSTDEVKQQKRAVQVDARDLYARIEKHNQSKWGPDGFSGSTPAFDTPEQAKAWYAKRDASKAFWKPFFDLYMEGKCIDPAIGETSKKVYCNAIIGPADHGINVFGEWPDFVRENFFPEEPDGTELITPSDPGGGAGIIGTADIARRIAVFKVRFDQWKDRLAGVIAGTIPEDPSKVPAISAIPPKALVDKALKESDLDTGAGKVVGKVIGGDGKGLFDDLGGLVTIVGFGVVAYVGLQVFTAFGNKAAESKSAYRSFRAA